MASPFYISQGDTKPDLGVTCTEAGVAVDLTDASVQFIMSLVAGFTPKVNDVAMIIDAVSGEVAYSWQAGDTDSPGIYKGEFEVTFADGTIQTFPNNDYVPIVIKSQLGSAPVGS